MKSVLQLQVDEQGDFSWVFDPEVDIKTLPPHTLCAASMELQSHAAAVLGRMRAQAAMKASSTRIDLSPADQTLEMFKRRNGH